jgi:hypothetical protein
MSEFNAIWDKEVLHGRSLVGEDNYVVRYHGKHVHAKLSAGTKSKFFLESGQVVLWRNENDNALSLAFFERDATSAHFPAKLIVPLGHVIGKKCTYVISDSVGPRGRFKISTSCSVDMAFSTKPMDLIFYLNHADAKQLDHELMIAYKKWPGQSELTYRSSLSP